VASTSAAGRRDRLRIALLVTLAMVAAPRRSDGYCRRSTCAGRAATVCDPIQPDDCGVPVRWPDAPLVYELPHTGDALHRAAADAVDRALVRWRDTDCGEGRRPDLAFVARAGAGAAAAVIALRDDEPARGPGTLAITRLWFTPDTGRVLRASVAFYIEQLRPHGPGAFLDSIALHEVGHLLGLAHSRDPSSVMSEDVHDGTTARVELTRDDIAAVCAIYPPPGVRNQRASWPIALIASALAAVILGGSLAGFRRRQASRKARRE
jgi:hypothetical protein